MPDYKTGRPVVLALLLLGAALAVVARFGQPRFVLDPRPPATEPVLALVPFENLSGDPDLELLAAELTAALSKSLGGSGFELRVHEAGWVHSGTERGIERIAFELSADYVVAGSVDGAGERIEVDAYLYRADADQGLWAERMTWNRSELDSIPGELARRVASALRY
jgi:TolB-like protein